MHCSYTFAYLAYDSDLTEVASTTTLNQDHTSSKAKTVDVVTSSYERCAL